MTCKVIRDDRLPYLPMVIMPALFPLLYAASTRLRSSFLLHLSILICPVNLVACFRCHIAISIIELDTLLEVSLLGKSQRRLARLPYGYYHASMSQ